MGTPQCDGGVRAVEVCIPIDASGSVAHDLVVSVMYGTGQVLSMLTTDMSTPPSQKCLMVASVNRVTTQHVLRWVSR